MKAIEAIEEVDWSRYIEGLKEQLEDYEADLAKLRVTPIPDTSSLKHRSNMLNSIRLSIIQTRKKIKDREANVRAQETRPLP